MPANPASGLDSEAFGRWNSLRRLPLRNGGFRNATRIGELLNAARRRDGSFRGR